MTDTTDQKEELPLSKAAQFLLEECRMVLPGMQALFGFQLIAVFSQTFDQKLSAMNQVLHLIALALVAIAIGLVMTPAALHRKTEHVWLRKSLLIIQLACCWEACFRCLLVFVSILI